MPKTLTAEALSKAITELNEKLLDENISNEGTAEELAQRIIDEVEVYDTDEKQLSSGCWNVLGAIDGLEIKTMTGEGDGDSDDPEPDADNVPHATKKGAAKVAASKKGTSKKAPAVSKKAPAVSKKGAAVSKKGASKKPAEKKAKLSREDAVCRVVKKATAKAGKTIEEIATAANGLIVEAGGKDNLTQTEHVARTVVRGIGNYLGVVEEVTKGHFRYVG